MNVLVLGATGTVGGLVTRQLLDRGARVSTLTRSAERAATLPSGVKAHVGDLNAPHDIGAAFTGADAVFLLNAVSATETQEGLFALALAKQHDVRKLVYLSVQYPERAAHLPHFGSKAAIEMAIKQSALDYAILQPNNFYQNDYWFKDVLLQYGVYPQPLGAAGVQRVDVRDIADAAVAAIDSAAASRQTYVVAGPTVETGASTAATWSTHLGRPIAYAGDDLEAWEQTNLQYLPAWMVFDFKMMYAHFQAHGLQATPAEMEATERLVGHPARSFDAFAAETAAAWKG